MVDGEDLDPVLPSLQNVAGRHLDNRQGIGQAAKERLEIREEVAQPTRPVHREPELLAAPQRERLEHPRQAEHVVGMEVRQEDLLDLRQPNG